MRKKQIMSLALTLCLMCGMTSAFAAGGAGSASDPLISKSYIDGTYPSVVLGEPVQIIKDSMAVLLYKLGQKVSGISYHILSAGAGVTAFSGGSFTLMSGMVTLSNLNGVLIDVTDGSVVSTGQSLVLNHRYVASANTTASITATTAARISAMGSVSTKDTPMSFTDVPLNAWFYQYVQYAYSSGLVDGKSATDFAPDDYLKINEAIKLAACMHQLYNTGSVTLVNSSPTWYNSYLEYAIINGILTRLYQNYDAYIARDEFVNIFYNALPAGQYTAVNSVADNAIPDVKMTDDYAPKIYAFYRAGILNGMDAYGSFLPSDNIRRSEVAAILTRMFETNQRVPITLQ